MGTYVSGAGVVSGTRLTANPASHMTQKDITKNLANVADITRQREMLAQGKPGTPYTARETNLRFNQLNSASKQVQDAYRADKVFLNRQTSQQVSIPVPGDDKIIFKTEPNLKEHNQAKANYERFMRARDRAAAKGDKSKQTYWANQMRKEIERHVAKNHLVGAGSAIAASFFAVDTLQKDLNTYNNILGKLDKYSSQKTAHTNSKSLYNKQLARLTKSTTFKSETKHLPKIVKESIKNARAIQRSGLTGNKARIAARVKYREKKAEAFGKIINTARGRNGTIAATIQSLNASRDAIRAKADRIGIVYSGISRQRLNGYTGRIANNINGRAQSKSKDSDYVRGERVNTFFNVYTREGKREALAAARSGRTNVKQL